MTTPIGPEDWADPDVSTIGYETLLRMLARLKVREAEHSANVDRIEGLEEEFVSRGLQLIALTNGLAAAQSVLETLQVDLDAAESVNATQTSNIGTNTSEIASLKLRMSAAEASITSMNTSIVAINTRLGLVNALLHLW